MVMATANKVVLAYSGGLDTSVIVRWLQETYQCEVVTFTADLGQGEELGPARDKALLRSFERTYPWHAVALGKFTRQQRSHSHAPGA